MTAISNLLDIYRKAAATERKKGSYFEDLIIYYLRNEVTYKDLYSDVWTYGQWAEIQALDKRDAGIDLVEKTRGIDEFHAIQCKLYSENYRLQMRGATTSPPLCFVWTIISAHNHDAQIYTYFDSMFCVAFRSNICDRSSK
jgi:hypothetical protein